MSKQSSESPTDQSNYSVDEMMERLRRGERDKQSQEDGELVTREDGTIFSGTVTSKGLEDIKESSVEETVIATPVALNGRLLVRGDQHLFCFGE